MHVQLQITYGKSATLPNISPDPSVSSGPNWTERPGTLSGTLLQDKKIQSRMLEKQMQKEKVICLDLLIKSARPAKTPAARSGGSWQD